MRNRALGASFKTERSKGENSGRNAGGGALQQGAGECFRTEVLKTLFFTVILSIAVAVQYCISQRCRARCLGAGLVPI